MGSPFLPFPEAVFIHQFFESVAQAVARRMESPSVPSEDHLTSLLCELLDDNWTSHHVISYPLSRLNADLEKCPSWTSIDIMLETHKHTQHYEGRVSFADLGIVIEWHAPDAKVTHKKAILVQCKRLYHDEGRRSFTLDSAYKAFDYEQVKAMARVLKRTNSSRGGYYLLFNPLLSAFPPDERVHIWGWERGHYRNPWAPDFPLWHSYELWASHAMRFPGDGLKITVALLRAVNNRPGLRVVSHRHIMEIAESQSGGRPRLRDLYNRCYSLVAVFPCDCCFAPFADFMVLWALGCGAGSDDARLIRIAEGTPPSKAGLEEEDNLRAPAYTLRISIRTAEETAR